MCSFEPLQPRVFVRDVTAGFLLVGPAVLSAAGPASNLGCVTELAGMQVGQAAVLHDDRAEDVQVALVVAGWLRRWTRNPLGSPRAGSNPADYAFCRRPCAPGRLDRALFFAVVTRICAGLSQPNNTPPCPFCNSDGCRHSREPVGAPCSYRGCICVVAAATPVRIRFTAALCRERRDVLLLLPTSFLQLDFASASLRHPVRPPPAKEQACFNRPKPLNPGSNPGHGSPLPLSDGDVLLLFATSSLSWILRLKLFGILCCPPPAKRAGLRNRKPA
ncbi:hypothetical protein ROHU_035472 [Labeo rohita]|uniref:Uncharacterized protein n=1 Tax=Labeo rohita TaxID=84645 RepID=A0A498LPP7_LABRO|nr:hypothetical protein ROHU_035472 [Labeo rohita]